MKALLAAAALAVGVMGASVTGADALTIHIGGHGHGHHTRYCKTWGWHHHHHNRYCRGWGWR